MPKRMNRQAVKSEVKRMTAFVMSLADEKDTLIQQDGDRVRLYVEGKEVFLNE